MSPPQDFVDFLPSILPIQSKIALPDSVPIKAIIDIDKKNSSQEPSIYLLGLDKWKSIHELIEKISNEPEIPCDKEHTYGGNWHDEEGRHRKAENLEQQYLNIPPEYKHQIKTINELRESLKNSVNDQRKNEFDLAHKLICKVAEIDSDFLEEILKHSLDVKKQGYVSAIIDRINKNLSERLNFPSWWVQDQEFKLVVSSNNYHLKFAIKDKTGTTYSFSERSQGLRYFLSYYIQYKSHQPPRNKQEILLMDEPDAYLSSQAQQDLMKIFKAFADGKDEKPPVQVIFVTHSPFLIDKNHPERIRVLEKGTEEEGTRIVKDIARNHYEPLRSSVGSLIGETAFIGNCNLIVSSLSDQVLISGLATYLNQLGVSELDTLDLNHITIVPAGDISQIPYLVHLLQRDTEKPSIITLLNSNDESENIYSKLESANNQTRKPLLEKDFMFQVSELGKRFKELEDLIPFSIAIKAIDNYIKDTKQEILKEPIKEKSENENSLFKYLEEYLQKQNILLDRFGFVKSVLQLLPNPVQNKELIEDIDIKALKSNFKNLFNQINEKKNKAEIDFGQVKISEKVGRFIKAFKLDHPKDARRVDAEELFKKIKNILDISEESNKTRETIDRLCQDYTIQNDPLSKIDKYEDFLKDLDRIKYTPLLSSQESEQENQYPKAADPIPNVDSMQKQLPDNSNNKSRQRKSSSSYKGFSSLS